MKSFRNKLTGIIETPNNEMVIEQLAKNENYEEYKPVETKEAVKEPTLKELKALADEKGIEYNTKTTKAELLELLNNAE